MIKFRCGHCDQKLGVPDEWAGKRIRCNRCKESCLVPHPQIELQTAPTPAQASVSPELQMPDDGNEGVGMTSDLLVLQAGTVLPREERHAPIVPKTRVPVPEYRVSPGDTDEEPSRVVAAAKGFGKIPLCIGLGFACAIGVAAAWGGISMVTGFRFSYFAIGVASAAAWGLVLPLNDRNVGLGLLGAFIGLVGIFCGKYFVARWSVMPRLQTVVNQGLNDIDTQTLSREQRNALIRDPNEVYQVVCMQLAQDGQFSRETALEIVVMKITDKVPAELSPEFVAAREKTDAAMTKWNDSQKMEALKMQHGPLQRALPEKFLDSKVGSALTTTAAFIGSFSLFDLMWFPMALWAAFKIGNGNDT